MKHRLIAILVLIAAFGSGSAQQNVKRSNYKLLWKISGKGLKKPSYLFGTMHVQDNKAFDFSDSVLLKISECEAFALEFHPDSVTRLVFSVLLGNDRQQKNKFRELLSDKEYSRLDSLMIKRTGFSLTKFNAPSRAKYFLLNKTSKKHKRTFLDAWLFNIAREQNKIIIGLEDTRTQLEALDETSSEEMEGLARYLESDEDMLANPFESMLDIYYRGDIDELRTLTKSASGEKDYDEMVTKRNLIMADRIKEEIHSHSTFIAVGAAHLPGDEGIIELLRDEGYSVTPMQPAFTGLAAKYTYTNEAKWVQYTSSEGGYAIEMPQNPVPFKPDTVPLTFQACIDIGTPAIYMTTHFPLSPEYKGQPASKIFDTMEKNLRRINKPEGSAKIKVQGLEAREIEFLQGGQYFKVQLIHRGNVLYMLMAGPSREFIRSTEAAKFFSSFRAVPIRESNEANNFVHNEGAFSIRMPGKVDSRRLTPKDPDTGERFRINLFHTTNMTTGETFLIRYNDFPAGYVCTDDSVYYAGMMQTVIAPTKGTNLRHRDAEIAGFKGVNFSFEAGDKVQLHGAMVLRGNRYYLALTTGAISEPPTAAQEFLNSLRFMPYAPTPVRQTELPEGITVTVPDTFIPDSAITRHNDGKIQYDILDDRSGIAYMLIVEKISRYTEEKDVDKFLKELMDTYATETDSVVVHKSQHNKNDDEIEADIISNRVNTMKRIKIVLAGDKTFTLCAYLPADYGQSDFPEKFFRTFSINNNTPWSLLSDKTGLILRDIASTDSLTQVEAEWSIMSHHFEKADLPAIYEAINKSYEDDNNDYGGVRNKLFNKLKIVNDASTLGFIKTVYSQLPDSTQLRDNALSVLAALKSEKAVNEMLTLLKGEESKRQFNGYTILNPLYDSLELLNAVLPDLFQQEPRFEYPTALFNIVKMALDSGVLKPLVKEKVIDEILAVGKKIAKTNMILQREHPHYNEHTNRLIGFADLLTALPFTTDIKNIMEVLQQSGALSIMMTTSIHLLKNDIAVDPVIVDKIAADPGYRLGFYEAMQEIKKEKLINPRYLTTAMIAESELYRYMEYEDIYPEKTELLKVRKVLHRDEKKNLYVYKYKYEDDDTWYFAIAGPYPLKSKEVPDRGELTSTFYEPYENNKQLDEALTKYLGNYSAELLD